MSNDKQNVRHILTKDQILARILTVKSKPFSRDNKKFTLGQVANVKIKK